MDRRREEIARVTNGYSPAMIEQVTSMALTIAHHDGREAFVWEDLVEAMTTLETGTAVGVEYVPKETRAVAIHEAGHAIAGHAYMEGTESTRPLDQDARRLARAPPGAREGGGDWAVPDRDVHAACMEPRRNGRGARLHGENSVGVGGDVQSATAQAAAMVGAAAMGPQPFEIKPKDGETEDEARKRVLERFEGIGLQIMNRTGGGPFTQDPIASALGDLTKRALAAQILGQAYVVVHNLVAHNRGSGGEDRRHAGRAPRDLRRRPHRPARFLRPPTSGARLRGRGHVASSFFAAVGGRRRPQIADASEATEATQA